MECSIFANVPVDKKPQQEPINGLYLAGQYRNQNILGKHLSELITPLPDQSSLILYTDSGVFEIMELAKIDRQSFC